MTHGRTVLEGHEPLLMFSNHRHPHHKHKYCRKLWETRRSGSPAVAVQLNLIYLIMLRGQLDVGLQGSECRCPH